ncbi:hypothetical protein CB1_000316007 [Camelus ferus]|nr:hypothetical protein CB1_000316007 [Camelus ferus]
MSESLLAWLGCFCDQEPMKLLTRRLMKEFPLLSMFNIHENLLEALLELQAYADVQAVLAKYDDRQYLLQHLFSLHSDSSLGGQGQGCHSFPCGVCLPSTALELALGVRFSPEAASRRGLSTAEMNAVEAIHRAVEFNPHVPKYLLEMKSLILPPEHILKRGDSEAIAYAFFHLAHWKRVEGALNLLHSFRMIPYPLEKGHLFYPYPVCTETADRELLPYNKLQVLAIFPSPSSLLPPPPCTSPSYVMSHSCNIFKYFARRARVTLVLGAAFHEVSVYPKKELPFFILFTAGLCSFTAMLALLTHQFPELMGVFAKAALTSLKSDIDYSEMSIV